MADVQNYEDEGMGAIFDLSFKRFITLSVIKVLFVLGILMIALMWLIGVGGAFVQGGFLGGILGLIVVSVWAVIQVIFLRVGLELIVVIFRIGENTSKLVALQGGGTAGDDVGVGGGE